MDRLNPKIRLSWSSYKSWKANDWESLESYYLNLPEEPNEYMVRGKKIHSQLEFMEVLPEVSELSTSKNFEKELRFEKPIGDYLLVGVIDLISDDIIVDYKTGGMSGYADQLNLYNWGMGGNREMYLVKVNDGLEVEKIQKTRKKDIDWESTLKQMGSDIYDYFLKF